MRINRLNNKKVLPAVFIVGFAIIGTIMLFRSFALTGNSSISGYAFNDSNRNGLMDAGESPFYNHILYLFDSTHSNFITSAYTDSNGYFKIVNIPDGDYVLNYGSTTWWSIRNDWTPTTTGSLTPTINVHVVGTANANFGWRKVNRSTDINAPISTFIDPSGLEVRTYNDVIAAKDIRDNVMAGSSIGDEVKTTRIYLDYGTATDAVTSIGGSPATGYSGFSASLWISYISWLDDDHILWHEYGHSWGQYNDCITQQDCDYSKYLKARNLSGDSRIYTSKSWDPGEMLAEDYRQLFGATAAGRNYPQANTDIPLARDVPGLLEFLSDIYTKSSTSTAPPAPSSPLTAAASLSAEGPQVQLSWGASSGATTYDIYRNGAKIGYTNSPGTTYVDVNNLAYSTNYSYYIKPVASNGSVGAASNTVTVTTPASDGTAPSAPTNLTSSNVTSTSITICWAASTDNVKVVSYNMYLAQRKLSPKLLGSVDATCFVANGLKPGTSYTFNATALDAAGNESGLSANITARTKR